MQRSTLLVLACAAPLACGPQELTNRERLVQAELIEAGLNTWVRHMNNGKRDSVVAMYDSSAALVVVGLDNQRALGFEEASRLVNDFFDRISFMNFVLQDPKIDIVSRNVAVTVFRHSTDIVLANRSRIPLQAGPGSIVWVRRRDGAPWMIRTQHIAITLPRTN